MMNTCMMEVSEKVVTFSGIEEIQFDKIYAFLLNKKELFGLHRVSCFKLTKMIISDILVENMSTSDLNIETCKLCLDLSYSDDYQYYLLAGYIFCDNLHKNTTSDIGALYKNIHASNPNLLADSFIEFVNTHADVLGAYIDYSNDFRYDYFGLVTLEKGYIIRLNKNLCERPQQMLMRVAVQIHVNEEIDIAEKLGNIKKTYESLSSHRYTHATPTMFNSGYKRNQLSSCFLLGNLEDSIESIYGNALYDSALISKNSGGIGIALHSIRSKNSYIRGTNGFSNGVVPMMRVFESTAKYVDQGGGKRNGSIAFFLEPWHADIEEFLNSKRPSGDESLKLRDLFFGLWIPDLFMKRLHEDRVWSLFCPHTCPGLDKTYGKEFEDLYEKYEEEHRYTRQVKASDLFYIICDTLIETGTPYILFKDNVNKYSNQKNLGTIRSSNLCCEIMQYSDPEETAVCNLASINLTHFVVSREEYDYDGLHDTAYQCTVNLNNVIDASYSPTKSCERSNSRHRPIAVGVQGLANVFYKMKTPVESNEAKIMNDNIFETIYHGCLSASVDLAKKHGPYDSFEGSPFSRGMLQFNLMDKIPGHIHGNPASKTPMYDWDALKRDIVEHGTRNSLVTAVMPTASTSQILGNYESIEIPQTNLFIRTTKAGKFPVINRYLIEDLEEAGVWNKDIQQEILVNKGSIANIKRIPDHIKDLYKTVWEIKQKSLVDLSIDRQKYMDQSQSLNIYYNPSENNIYDKLISVMSYGWKNQLKTGIYYLRTKPASYALDLITPSSCETCSA